MRSVPGIELKRGAPKEVRVLCPSCGKRATGLRPGLRLAMRGVTPTGRETGDCENCGAHYDLPVVEEGK